MIRIYWNGCYDGSWQSAPLVAEAYAHPAKVSFNLAERIYRHMLAEGWLQPGDAVIDPFGGVGGFAFHAALYGMHWTGVELEQRFVDLGRQNLELWRNRYAPHFPGYGTARLLQGDSRRLVEVVTGAGGVVSSPPFQGALQNSVERSGLESFGKPSHLSKQNHAYGSTPGNLGNMPAGVVSSPPYAASVNQGDRANDADARLTRKADAGVDVTQAINRGGPNSVLNKPQAYGSTPGQLGAMPAGVVSSPPYASALSAQTDGIDWTKGKDGRDFSVEPGQEIRLHMGKHYGTTPGQLGAMPAGVVSSPPYEGSIDHAPGNKAWTGAKPGNIKQEAYGETSDNIGNNTGDTFWSAATAIVAQCYTILRPGGYAAWVTGDFVRNKRRVPFGQQWLDLCVSCGFEPVLWAVAWKSEHNGTQAGLFGDARELRKEKVSFFRRLANQKNPDAAIANEDVLFVRKPL